LLTDIFNKEIEIMKKNINFVINQSEILQKYRYMYSNYDVDKQSNILKRREKEKMDRLLNKTHSQHTNTYITNSNNKNLKRQSSSNLHLDTDAEQKDNNNTIENNNNTIEIKDEEDLSKVEEKTEKKEEEDTTNNQSIIIGILIT